MFSSSDIIKVSFLIFNSLRHFEFIFVYDVREYSNFVYFYVSVQLSQYHLLKKLSLLNCIFLPPLSKINWLWVCGFIYGVSVPFRWSMCLFLCQYHALLFSVCLKSGRFMPSTLFFFLRISLAIMDLLWFQTNFMIICSSSVKNVMSNLIGTP